MKRRKFAFAGASLFALLAGGAFGQVISDGSTGAVAGTNWTNGTIDASNGISNSSQTTVVHSFSQFDLTSAQSITFSAPTSYTAIIARITSGSSSSIDGTITSTAANAKLYLVNPFGFVFGGTASINVPSTFYVSTGDHVNFANGGGSIPITATTIGTLSTEPVQDFGFLNGGTAGVSVNTGTLNMNGGALDIVSHGALTLNSNAKIVANSTTADGGSVTADVASLSMLDGAAINVDSTATTGKNAGTIDITTSDFAALSAGAGLATLSANADAGALGIAGVGGHITLNVGGALTMTNGKIEAEASGGSAGMGGQIDITAATIPNISNSSLRAWSNGNDGGTISLTRTGGPSTLNLFGSAIDAHSAGGNGGSISFLGNEILSVQNTSIDATSTTGNGGQFTDDGPIFSFLNSTIDLHASAAGKTGGSAIFSSDGVVEFDTGALVDASSANGAAGSITFSGGSDVTLSNATLKASSTGGAGGSITMPVISSLLVDTNSLLDASGTTIGGTILAKSFYGLSLQSGTALKVLGGTGSGGAITLDTVPGGPGDIDLSDVTLLANSTNQNGGTINIGSNNSLKYANADVEAHAAGIGNGGTISSTSKTLSQTSSPGVFYASSIFDVSSAFGNAGTANFGVVIQGMDLTPVTLKATAASGTGGQVSFNLGGDLILPLGYVLDVSGYNGGSINVQKADVFQMNAGSQLKASAFNDGGSISVNSNSVSILDDTVIAVGGVAAGSNGGSIDITTTGDAFLSGAAGHGPQLLGVANYSGSIQLTVPGQLTLGNATLDIDSTGSFPAGGSIGVTAGRFTITAPSTLSVAANGYENGGTINIKTTGIGNDLDLTGLSLDVRSSALDAGTINFDLAGALTLPTGYLLDASSLNGNGGAVNVIHSTGIVLNAGSGIVVSSAVNQSGGTVALASNGQLSLTSGAFIIANSTGGNAGTISANVASLDISGGSKMAAVSSGNGGTINLTTTGAASITGLSATRDILSAGSTTTATGSGGAINLSVGGTLFVDTANIDVTAGYGASTGSAAPGHAGTITVNAQSLATNNALMDASTGGAGQNGGAIQVTTTGAATFTGGDPGGSTVKTDSGGGNGGAINLQIGGALTLNTAQVDSSAGTGANVGLNTSGQAGTVAIHANSLTATNSLLGASAFLDNWNGGSVSVTTTNDASFNAASVFTNANTGSAGNISMNIGGRLGMSNSTGFDSNISTNGSAGLISLTTGVFDMSNSWVLDNTAAGNAGSILVSTGAMTMSANSYLQSQSSAGSGGTIGVTASSLNLDTGKIDAFSDNGPGGAITVALSGGLSLSNGSRLYAGTASGQAGNISVNADTVGLSGGSAFDASSVTGGNGGNIAVTGQHSITLGANGGSSVSTASGGVGGNIILQAPQIDIGVGSIGSAASILEGSQSTMLLRATTLNLGAFASLVSSSTFDSGVIEAYANTFNVATGAQVSSSATGGRVGNILFGSTNFNMTGGSITTQGPTFGVIAIGADETLAVTGGTISTLIGGGINVIAIGATLVDPVISNSACSTACLAFQPYATSWTPGTSSGVPNSLVTTSAATIYASPPNTVVYTSAPSGTVTADPPPSVTPPNVDITTASVVSQSETSDVIEDTGKDKTKTREVSGFPYEGMSSFKPFMTCRSAPQVAGVPHTGQDRLRDSLAHPDVQMPGQLFLLPVTKSASANANSLAARDTSNCRSAPAFETLSFSSGAGS